MATKLPSVVRYDKHRDDLSAQNGFIRVSHVARLLGIGSKMVYMFPVEFRTIQGARWYNWQQIIDFVGKDTVDTLNLPLNALDALKKSREIPTEWVNERAYMKCDQPSPADPNTRCERPKGHNGNHWCMGKDGSAGVEWTRNKKQRINPAERAWSREMQSEQARAVRARANDPSEVIIAELKRHEPDVPDPAFPGLPHTYPVSVYLGNPMNITMEKLNKLPEWSWRIPARETMRGFKWKANRNVQFPEMDPDWWQGEWLKDGWAHGVKWTKLMLSDKPSVAPPEDYDMIEAQEHYRKLAQDEADAKAEKPPVREQPVASEPPRPLPGNTLVCQTCQHDVSWHNHEGCTWKQGTPSACQCNQAAPSWYLEQLRAAGKVQT